MDSNRQVTRSIFIESLVGNIKEKYFFEKKLGSGGYGAVYLARNKQTGKSLPLTLPQGKRWQ
jgi:serine/threonine protein kinase